VGLRCKRCGSEEHVKNGLMRTKQRYLCKACGLNFTDTPPRGKPLALKVAAVLLYVSGLSMNRTAKLLGVSTPTIQAWLEQFAAAYAQKPEPEGRAVVIELDEMWHYLKKSPSRSGSGRLGIVLQGSWWTGNAAVVTRSPVSACSSG
jgi:transposase